MGLLSRDWAKLSKEERAELDCDSLKALKLLTSAVENVELILDVMPMFLF